LLGSLLRQIPVASLAGVLVYTGVKLVDFKALGNLSRYGRMPMLVYAATALAIVFTDLLTGVLVSVSGAIGFVGLMLPHAARLLVGAEHRRLLPVCALLGALFLVWMDVAARTLIAPQDLPIGIATAAIGGLFFILLLRRRS
ncbi:MAG: iron chelate uptake ABC transporter family permease subunit, partial [Pseudomonas aeruginosa]|nr:iron chelate uptake ABC transporter family permease subunit [Pseudomonas aeruginosa]